MGRPIRQYDGPGQPTKFTEVAHQSIRNAAAIGANIKETCLLLGISLQTYYNWKENEPAFFEEIELQKQRMPLKAKQNIAAKIEAGDIDLSRWLLEKKDPEFRPTSKVEHTGSLDIADTGAIERSPAELKALDDLRKARLERIKKEIDQTP
jgi:hypothetical protein